MTKATKPTLMTAYGALLRQRRTEAGLSLRDVAAKLGVSHVYLADVERGTRGPLKPEHEPALLQLMRNVRADELERARAVSRPVKISVENAPSQYQELVLALAKRMEQQDLTETQLQKLMKLLSNEEKEKT